MPSQENVKLKQEIIDEIGGKLEKANGVVVIDYIGISVDEANRMRVKLRDAGVDYKVYKNTLVKRAIDGTANAGLAEILDGPSAFAFGYDDAIAPARVLDSVMKEYKKMEFKAGIIEGVLYDADGIKQIAAIPPKDVLIARFLGSIQSPISKLVRTFAAIAEDQGGGEAAAPAEEPAPVEEAAPAEVPAEDEAKAEDEVKEEAAAEEAPAEAEEEAKADDENEAEAEAEAVADEAPEEE